jgi:hypothetical protein
MASIPKTNCFHFTSARSRSVAKSGTKPINQKIAETSA